jgi:glycosyltransferase involved in cell wall biosynthesis
MKVALVHYWLLNMRGGEKVLEALCELFPDADIFTHAYDPSAVSDSIRRHKIYTTFIQKLPMATRYCRNYLPLMPIALEQLDLRGYDLVISSESGPAKGVMVSPDALHICYCHTPMRYVWDMYYDYLKGARSIKRILMRPLIHYLRMWDLSTASRVDYFIANSNYVAKRILRHYRRESEVIHPPVDVGAFTVSDRHEDFYLMVGELVPYKRFDIAVCAFTNMGKKLIIIGDGNQMKIIKKIAGPTITFLRRQPFNVMRDYYARCRALIFPCEEDFGIVPVEAMASGRPVIAFKKGGALETVVEGLTGLFFNEQSPESLIDAINRYELIESTFSPEQISLHARKFDRERFKEHIQNTIKHLLKNKDKNTSWNRT